MVGRPGRAARLLRARKAARGPVPAGLGRGSGGCCVGEVRKLAVPPVLGFGDKGAPKRGVPPYAPLDYTIELLGINGNNQPR